MPESTNILLEQDHKLNFIETHRAFVNSWECDENDHLNVQFYWKRFAEASQIFAAFTGMEWSAAGSRHVRYHRELRASESTFIRSSLVSGGDHDGFLVHEMVETASGDVAATAIEPIEPMGNSTSGLPSRPAKELAHAMPRSLTAEPIAVPDYQQMLQLIEAGTAILSHHACITPAECDVDGNLLDQFHISRFSDGAPHLWDLMNLDVTYLLENNLGRVAVEMKMTRHTKIKAGQLIQVISLLGPISAKTISLQHHIFDTRTHEALFSGEATGLIMDLAARKVVAIPDRVRQLAS